MRLFRHVPRLAAAAVLFGGLVVVGPGAGGQPPKKADKEFTGQGQVKAGVHKVRMDVGKLYLVRVDATAGFTPSVSIRPGNFLSTGDSFVTGDQFTAYVLPKESREYRLTVLPSVDDDELDGQALDYSVTVTPIPMAKQPLVNEESKLTFNDPVYQNPAGGNRGPHKAFTANFKAGQIYIITVDAEDKGNFDPYLQVEGAGGKVIAQDDDGGGYPNCRIVLKPKRGGEHRLIVTSVGKGQGSFNLKVITTVAGAKVDPPGGGKDVDPGKE